MKNQLPPVGVGVPKTLIIRYTDGIELKVPYFDVKGAEAFIHMNGDQITEYEVVEFSS